MSSCLVVQVGQCGNALGAAIFDAIANDRAAQMQRDEHVSRVDDGQSSTTFARKATAEEGLDADAFFSLVSTPSAARGRRRVEPVARAVLVDTEPKALDDAMRIGRGRWSYDPSKCVAAEGGAGNSWGRGFHHMAGGEATDDGAEGGLLAPALDAVRHQVERCDSGVHAIALLQSAAGGTGAGLGARAAQALRDEFPRTCLTSFSVWPASQGEVSVQAYNACLSLTHVADAADAVVLVQNDALSNLCRSCYQLSRPSLSDLNQVAARALAPALLPASLLERTSSQASPLAYAASYRPPRPMAWLDEAATHPWYKLLQVRSHPHLSGASASFERFSFDASSRALMRMHANSAFGDVALRWGDKTVEGSPKAVHLHLCLRGYGSDDPRAHASSWSALAASTERRTSASSGWPISSVAYGGADRAPPGAHVCARTSSSSSPSSPSSPSAASGDTGVAVLVSNSSDVVEPLRREAERARRLLCARAFVHRYESDGVDIDSLRCAVDGVDALVDRYDAL
ncbi:tubulin delta chain [Pseudoscourfieldia marina]